MTVTFLPGTLLVGDQEGRASARYRDLTWALTPAAIKEERRAARAHGALSHKHTGFARILDQEIASPNLDGPLARGLAEIDRYNARREARLAQEREG